MAQPTFIKDVQRLPGRVIALKLSMSKLAEKCLSFFKKLRKSSNFEWTNECQKAFKELKEYLGSPKLLSRLVQGEELFIYLAAFYQAFSAVLI